MLFFFNACFFSPALFVENVLSEVKGQAGVVTTDMTGSLALQKLLSLSSPKQVAEVLAELGGETGSEFKTVSCDRCGGHVMESSIKQMAKWTGKNNIINTVSMSDNEGRHEVIFYLYSSDESLSRVYQDQTDGLCVFLQTTATLKRRAALEMNKRNRRLRTVGRSRIRC